MSKFSRIQEIKATTTAAIQVTALESESISILQEKYNFPVLCCEILISGMFCNVGWPAGGLCWTEWVTLLLWPHNCDTRAVQTILRTSVIRALDIFTAVPFPAASLYLEIHITKAQRFPYCNGQLE